MYASVILFDCAELVSLTSHRESPKISSKSNNKLREAPRAGRGRMHLRNHNNRRRLWLAPQYLPRAVVKLEINQSTYLRQLPKLVEGVPELGAPGAEEVEVPRERLLAAVREEEQQEATPISTSCETILNSSNFDKWYRPNRRCWNQFFNRLVPVILSLLS